MAFSPITDQQMMNRESARNVFRTEVCRRYCKICSAEKPNLCMMLMETMKELYFTKILYVIDTARSKNPRLYDDFDTFEGFVALFCDARLCPFYVSGCSLVKKIDCYQMFLAQSNMEFEPGEEESILNSYDSKLMLRLCNEINEIDKRNQTLSGRKKKKMKKIAIRIMNMVSNWTGKTKSDKNTNRVSQIGKRGTSIIVIPPKKVTTHLFYGGTEEFKERIKSILAGGT